MCVCMCVHFSQLLLVFTTMEANSCLASRNWIWSESDASFQTYDEVREGFCHWYLASQNVRWMNQGSGYFVFPLYHNRSRSTRSLGLLRLLIPLSPSARSSAARHHISIVGHEQDLAVVAVVVVVANVYSKQTQSRIKNKMWRPRLSRTGQAKQSREREVFLQWRRRHRRPGSGHDDCACRTFARVRLSLDSM